MGGGEQFRSRILAGLAEIMTPEEAARVMRIIDEVSVGYEITRISTELTVVEEIPELVKSYIASKAVEGKSQGTLTEYLSILRTFFRETRKRVQDITTNDIRIYIHRYRDTHQVGDSRMASIRVVLNAFLEWCTQEEEIQRNPARRIEPIKVEQKEREALSPVELERMRMACRTIREKAVVDFLYSTGCRVSEMVNVKLSDIDFPSGTVKIRKGKGKKERHVYLNAECEVSLRAYLDGREDETPYLIVESRRPYKHIGRKSIERIVEKIWERTGISFKVVPHNLRHTTATTAIRNGMPVEQVKEMLGHESLDTTMIYAKTARSQVQASHQRCVT